MNKLELFNKDIESLEKALKLIEKTELHTMFNKPQLIFEICKQINILKDKKDKHIEYVNGLCLSSDNGC